MSDINPSVIEKNNHNLFTRFQLIKSNLASIGVNLDDYKISVDKNPEEGTISYELELNNIQFPKEKIDNFRMELKELAYTDVTVANVTNIVEYRFQGTHKVEDKWSKKDYIAFDYEPNKTKYPKIHINAYAKKWGDHLSYPESTNLNLYKMSCPLALKVFEIYGNDINDFPADKENNQHYVKLFEEVDEYGKNSTKV